MKLYLLVVLVLASVARLQAGVADQKCWAMHLLSKHPQSLDPPHGSHNWEAQGDYSGTHLGPFAIASLDESGGWRLDGVFPSFETMTDDMEFTFNQDVDMPYKPSSLGDVFTIRAQGSSFTFNYRLGGPLALKSEDLNHQEVNNAFSIEGDLAFTVSRKIDGATYDGVMHFTSGVVAGTAFNGLGFHGTEFVDETLTVWLWGTETNGVGTGYSFLKNEIGYKPLALDIVISGEYVECDELGGGSDPCEAFHTCDPEQCGDDCECILHANKNCAKLNVVPGSLGDCEVTI